MPTSTEISPHKIAEALARVHDQKSFLNDLLAETLDWPVDTGVKEVDEITYEWSETDLRARDLSKKLIDGKVLQVQLTTDQAWGIFILEFKRPDVFTSDRGMTGVLRQVLRGLVKNRNKPSSLPSWQRDNLLFISTHNYEHFRIAHFKAPREDGRTARLAAFGWGPDIPARTACEFNLNHLGWPSSADRFDHWTEAFNVEKVTKKFYGEYKDCFDTLRASVKGLGSGTEDQKMFTQTLLNRLMFLRFIERKGWLRPPGAADDRDYLRLLFAAGNYRGKSFYAGRLRKLFFEGLAVEGKQESESIGKVPFLNGGLFEQNALDEKVPEISNEAFAPLLGPDGLFYRYNFTVQESTPLDVEVAVDPEMLGKVFEELVTGRHESGSYYTPRPIVSFMCREALKAYLTAVCNIPIDGVAAFVDNHIAPSDIGKKQRLAAALDSLRAVDPACGSGAYLLGLLHEMVDLYQLIFNDNNAKGHRSIYDLKLRIISNSIYGVDIDKFATNIAMLRLWLSLSVDSETPLPLPNLEFKIETGDSLLGPDPSGMADLFRQQLQRRADLLVKLKEKYLQTHNPTKHDQLEAIRKEECAIAIGMGEQVGEGIIDWRIQFAEVFAGKSAESTMEGYFPQLNKTPKSQISFTVGEQRGGFDIVLANPPYVDSETMTKHSPGLRELIVPIFAAARGNWDLYIPFWERSVELGNSRSSVTLITPNKWLSIAYGEALRRQLNGKISMVVQYDGFRPFPTAGVSPVVVAINNSGCTEIAVHRFDENYSLSFSNDVPAEFCSRFPTWGLLLSRFQSLVMSLVDRHVRLGQKCTVEEACTVGEAYKLSEIVNDGRHVVGSTLRLINTGTIDPYRSLWGSRVTRYLKKRYDAPIVSIAELQAVIPRLVQKAQQRKIIISGLRYFEAFCDEQGEYLAGKSTVVLRDLNDNIAAKALMAILHSSMTWLFLRETYGTLGIDGGINFSPSNVREIPIPELSQQDCDFVTNLVDEILRRIANDIDADVADIQRRIDEFLATKMDVDLDEVLAALA
jgi:hypothetical protein